MERNRFDNLANLSHEILDRICMLPALFITVTLSFAFNVYKFAVFVSTQQYSLRNSQLGSQDNLFSPLYLHTSAKNFTTSRCSQFSSLTTFV